MFREHRMSRNGARETGISSQSKDSIYRGRCGMR